MDQPIVAIELALRVLTATNEGRQPEEADVEQLRLLAPAYADRSEDELATKVVQQASKDLKKRDHPPALGQMVP